MWLLMIMARKTKKETELLCYLLLQQRIMVRNYCDDEDNVVVAFPF